MRNILLLALMIFSIGVFATENENTVRKGDVTGTVVDASDGRPVEYATIALYKTEGDKLVTGGISDSEGFFRIKNVKPENYYLTVTFMGYTTKTIPNITITDETKEVELGKIMLAPNVKELEGVDVVADQASVQYKIDKKVVNVSQQLTAKSGTAVDILENVPSVKVDIEGNVTLRGSGSFTVLIDGRPTVLDPSDALSQIPAGAIENIEIITNPSAKYEPDGTAGIINIVTKKNKLNGLSGVINVNAGKDERYGSDVTLDYRQNDFHFYVGGDFNNRSMPGLMEYERQTNLSADSTFVVSSIGDWARSSQRGGVRAGVDWNFTDADLIGISGRWGMRETNRGAVKDYEEYIAELNNMTQYITDDNTYRGGSFYSATLDYKHTFNENTEHYLQSQVTLSGRDGEEENTNLKNDLDGSILEAKQTTEKGPSMRLRAKIDYAHPFDWGGKIEAGGQLRISDSEEVNEVFDYDTTTNQYLFQDLYSNTTQYIRNTYAGYGIFGGEFGELGYQAGLRMEYTQRLLELKETGESYEIERPDFFPTLHFSYQMPADQQAMVSYTRRIERPRGWYLEPFITYMDANNIRRGNPGLNPEYVNSFELGYQKKFNSNFFSLEAYYRITENKIERVMSPYEEDRDIFLHTYENIGTDYALGVEGMFNYSPAKWYTTNVMLDLFDYRVKGKLYDRDVDERSFSWSSRLNNTFKASPNTRIQVDLYYRSAEVRAQGSSEGFFSVSTAVKQDFFKRKMSATLQVRDVFSTWQHEFETFGPDFNQYTRFAPNTPIVMLTLSYKINNYRNKRGEGGGEDGGMGEDGMM